MESLNSQITGCSKCPRLRTYCQEIAQTKKRMYADWEYWGRPVPNFGDAGGRLLIVGLAPAAHGANRTGRMFTGDQSGVWLYRSLFKEGFANQPHSGVADDGLRLSDCLITAVCHCAPPQNKPSPAELANCSQFLSATLISMKNLKVILCLGQIAWQNTWKILVGLGLASKTIRPVFSHGAVVDIGNGIRLVGSYHPSQQNTFTGKLTEPAFDGIFKTCRNYLDNLSSK